MRLWPIALLLALVGCLPALQPVDPNRLPSADNWGPNNSPLEWWYVSGYLPEEGLAFHWALFKAYAPQNWQIGILNPAIFFPGPYHASHIAVTDLRNPAPSRGSMKHLVEFMHSHPPVFRQVIYRHKTREHAG